MSKIANVADYICLMRQQICPKTSYATSGSAAKLLYVFENLRPSSVPLVNGIRSMLAISNTTPGGYLKSEFDSSEILNFTDFSSAAGSINGINGHVIVFLNLCSDDSHSLDFGISGSLDLLARKRSKLAIFISVESSDSSIPVARKNSMETLIAKKLIEGKYNNVTSNSHTINIVDAIENYTLNIEIRSLHIATGTLDRKSITDPSSLNMLGFNKQPAVCSRKQFKFLKQMNSDGWQRVLQRLAEKELHGKSAKFSTVQWDDIISKLLLDPLANDYTVYSTIRRYVLGSSLDEDLQITASHSNSGASDSAAKETKNSDSSGGGDGRASFLVGLTVENIPPHLYPPNASGPRGSQIVSAGVNPIKLLLDYGCAEGSLTAELGRQLNLTPQQVIGADVRVIASEGFTFLPLPAEEESAAGDAAAGPDLIPSLADGSVDLISAAMVFHHVTNISKVLLELRRLISPRGALIVREHDCVNASTAAFLDITHGLYSLSWSSPVEWPDFLTEYKAFYRSREEWNAVIEAAGFRRLKDSDPASSKKAGAHYKAAEFSRMNHKGRISNLTRAYYAVYVPDPAFKIPKKAASSVFSFHKEETVSIDTTNAKGATNLDENKSPESKKLRGEDAAPGRQKDSDQIFESKKYPGKFYRVNKVTGATEWIV